jgi:hypothetical protein
MPLYNFDLKELLLLCQWCFYIKWQVFFLDATLIVDREPFYNIDDFSKLYERDRNLVLVPK